MKSSLQTPKPLRKSRSRENRTPAISSVPSYSKNSDLSLSAVTRNRRIRPKSLDTDFLAASEYIVSDLADPVMISGESGSNLFIFTESPDLSLSDNAVEQLVATSESLAVFEHNFSDLPNLAMSSASSCTSDYSAQKELSLGENVRDESTNKGKNEEVVSASDLIKKALAEINESKDITAGTKKIMDAMFEAAVQQLIRGEFGVQTGRPADSRDSNSNPLVMSNSSNLSLSNITVEEKLVINSEYLSEPEHLPAAPHLAISPASSHTSECLSQEEFSLVPKVCAESSRKGKYEEVISPSDPIKKALSDIIQSKDIADDTKKIMDEMFQAAVRHLEGAGTSVRTVRPVSSALMPNLCIVLLLFLILIFAARLLLKFWFEDSHDWTHGLKPT